MKDILVGSTGFVGSNLKSEHDFEGLFHSADIKNAYGTKPELLVYSGVPAEMFTANNNPEEDRKRIEEAKENIRKIDPKEVVLISTVAVYSETKNVNEEYAADPKNMTAYGKNRYELECWIEENFSHCLIVRLPAIYGEKMKKNFLYDYIRRIPGLLKYEKYEELSGKEALLKEYYEDRGDGFYRCRELAKPEAELLKKVFINLGFTALNFTDSRSVYQFYPLKRLWTDIEKARANGIKKLNLVTPPVSAGEVYMMLEGKPFVNECSKAPFDYDIRTLHSSLFGREDGYVMSREEELEEIKAFVEKKLSENLR